MLDVRCSMFFYSFAMTLLQNLESRLATALEKVWVSPRSQTSPLQPISASVTTRAIQRWFLRKNRKPIPALSPNRCLMSSIQRSCHLLDRRPGFINFTILPEAYADYAQVSACRSTTRRAAAGKRKTSRGGFLRTERRQAHARRPHPLDHHRGFSLPNRTLPGIRCHRGQPHRRLGHAVRNDPPWLENTSRPRRHLSRIPSRSLSVFTDR